MCFIVQFLEGRGNFCQGELSVLLGSFMNFFFVWCVSVSSDRVCECALRGRKRTKRYVPDFHSQTPIIEITQNVLWFCIPFEPQYNLSRGGSRHQAAGIRSQVQTFRLSLARL